MAASAYSMIFQRTWPGLLSATFIGVVVLGSLGALLAQAHDISLTQMWHDSYLHYITRFSLYQATLSTLLSVLPAIPMAYALSRRRFIGRKLLLRLCAMTLVLPVLVAVFGLLRVYGHDGWITQLLHYFGYQDTWNIYGLSGILLAHVFLNLPFATRLLLQSLDNIPLEQHRLATQLGIQGWAKFRFVAWPRLREQLPHVAGLIFMLCFTSFAVIMTLGGGPKATTIELAIYQALRYDYQLNYGAMLALWQMVLCGGLVLLTQRLAKPIQSSANTHKIEHHCKEKSISARLWDSIWIALLILLVIPPLLGVISAGLNTQWATLLQQTALWLSVWHSLQIATLSSLSAIILGVCLVWASRDWRRRQKSLQADSLELIGTIILITPSVVLSTGIFLLLRHYIDVFSSAFWVVIAVNALVALPYVVKTLSQPMWHIAQQYHRLCTSLGMKGWQRFYWLEWRVLRRPISHSLALSFVLSMGDLGAIALFGSQNFQTLPLYLYQLMGSYQMQAAAVAALLLLILSLGLFTLIEMLLNGKKSCSPSSK
jgi:thiamine transport system permease protein